MFTDSMIFEVFQTKLKTFQSKVKQIEGLSIGRKDKDGGYYKITVYNKYSFGNWVSLIKFYKECIKI